MASWGVVGVLREVIVRVQEVYVLSVYMSQSFTSRLPLPQVMLPIDQLLDVALINQWEQVRISTINNDNVIARWNSR